MKTILVALLLSACATTPEAVKVKDVPAKDVKESPEVTKCKESLRNTICVALYMPATCSLDKVKGKKLEEPLVASGANSCNAMVELKMKGCERGFDPKTLKDKEIQCTKHDLPPDNH